MNKIYDNGALLIGNIDKVIEEVKKEMKEDLDMGYADQDGLLKELLELKESNVKIVMINYDIPMGYDINYWSESDEVK